MSTEDKNKKHIPVEDAEDQVNQQAAAEENAEMTEDTAAQVEAPKTEAQPEQDLQAKLEEQKDKYLRLYADFDNYKKRMARERLELIKEAGKDIVLTMLPVLDDFERAVKAAETSDDVKSVKEGMELIHHKLLRNLEQKGLKAMDSQGQPFDVDLHEAITEIPAPTDDLKGKVVDVVEKGYTLNDKIIRYAKVVVGK